jgi:2-oxoglutarate dehydrogenase complex dehydrogenase (E1) component-like enzyme
MYRTLFQVYVCIVEHAVMFGINCMLKKIQILFRISRSAGFENFLAKKWTAEKRFGLEGVEMLIPCMKQVIDR